MILYGFETRRKALTLNFFLFYKVSGFLIWMANVNTVFRKKMLSNSFNNDLAVNSLFPPLFQRDLDNFKHFTWNEQFSFGDVFLSSSSQSMQYVWKEQFLFGVADG